jgi:hypothetical protein
VLDHDLVGKTAVVNESHVAKYVGEAGEVLAAWTANDRAGTLMLLLKMETEATLQTEAYKVQFSGEG